MSELSACPITARRPAKHPDCLQLYSLPTPNGVKVSIMLEEVGPAVQRGLEIPKRP
jgi:GST-like protein